MISKKDMKQYRYILMETPDIEKRIKRSQKRLEKLENEGNVVDKVSGGEGGNQHFRIEGFPIAEYSREKTRMQQQMLRHEHNMAVLAQIEDEICQFIDSIPFSFINYSIQKKRHKVVLSRDFRFRKTNTSADRIVRTRRIAGVFDNWSQFSRHHRSDLIIVIANDKTSLRQHDRAF